MEVRAGDAFAVWDEDTVRFGNCFYTRTIDLCGGFPRTVSLKRGEVEFADPNKKRCDCSFFGINMPGDHETSFRLAGPISAEFCADRTGDAPHIELTIRFEETIQQATFERLFYIYPGLAVFSVRNRLTSKVIPCCYRTYREELSGPGNTTRHPAEYLESCAESIRLAAEFRPRRSVEFRGRTDYHNQPVIEHSLSGAEGVFVGNLLFADDSAGNTLVVLQEAPPSAERRDFEKHDFRLTEDRELRSCCWGIAPEELLPDTPVTGYRHTLLLCGAGEIPEELLHSYLAVRFPMQDSERPVVVNPWGCHHFPERVNPAFLLEEIDAAGQIGAEIYQIDDSWQAGCGLGELTFNNRAVDANFWAVSPERLPDGFEPLCRRAAESKIRLGLWCAPTFNCAYRDWKEFADLLIEYHRRYGFATVKIDGVRTPSSESERNLEALLARVRRETGGAVCFNLDTTNGQRPGYFLFLEYGNIFLENRYVDTEKTVGYHPEKTLRNFWLLSRYVRPQSLQIEVPAPDDVPAGMSFEHDPRDYSFDYWCAVALFGNMLIWTAPSQIGEHSRETLRKMIALHRSIRPELFAGNIRPILACPDGRSLTGFASDAGFRLYFRERGCDQDTIELPSNAGSLLAGNAKLSGNRLILPPGGFALWRAR